jgi:tRNA-dependent cyclodipeptide synthase
MAVFCYIVSMRIQTCLNTSLEEIASKHHNIWVGVSLGNKYFSEENLRKLIRWSLSNTKDHFLILIADEIHAINYQVINEYKPEHALAVALRKGQEIRKLVEKLVLELPVQDQKKASIFNWVNIKTESYYQSVAALENEFKNNPQFREYIVGIVNEHMGLRFPDLTLGDKEMLAQYILKEIPTFFHCVDNEGRVYTLHTYPGLSSLDKLLMSLQENKLFPDLAKKLKIEHKIAIAEAYAE